MPIPDLRDVLRHAPDPDDATRWLERLVAAGVLPAHLATGSHGQAVARIVCERAPYLAQLCVRDATRLARVAGDPYLRREKPRAVMAAELRSRLRGVDDEAALLRVLRRFRADEMVRLGARECGLGDPVEVGRELAALADCALDAACAFHDRELARLHGEPRYTAEDGSARRAGLCVIAMGKHGGEELNFASDVDVIYVYPSDEGAAGQLSLHEYFEKLSRRVTRALAEVTDDEWVFRVDLRLRPEGSRGPMVNALPSLERYYESWGRPWERQAWLKARPCAGDLAVGHAALEMLEPFVYPRSTSPAMLDAVFELNRKIKAELDQTRLGGGFHVKLGQGGIREVEFFVQALQLLHAGKERALRERSTRRALDKLLLSGLVAERERAQLRDAYDFLRQVEHLIQLESGAQAHRLPVDAHSAGVLARRLGLPDAGELYGRLSLHTGAVSALFATLGGAPPPPPAIAVLTTPDRPEAETRAALAELGFADPEQALLMLERLRKSPLSPLGAAAGPEAARLAPALFKEVAACPDPDQALAYLVELATRRAMDFGLWRLLDGRPALLRLLVSLLGSSAFLARRFVAHPELVDVLITPGPPAGRGELREQLLERLARVVPGDDEGAWNALRRGRHEALLRVALADIAGDLDVVDVGERLSELADACVDTVFAWVRASLARRRRESEPPPMAVLGLGKLGARELGYAADLDLIFVYDGDWEAHEAAARLAQRLMTALAAHTEEGRLYEVDTRLRPSGRQGTLVSSLTGWIAYHEGSAQLWERQALTKLRFVAGDERLGAAVEAAAQRFVYDGPPAPRAELASALGGMRARMETELGQEGPGRYDIKVGHGALADVEFAAQFLQLAHGAAHPGLRVRGTLAALEAAAADGLIPREAAATLADGWRFLRRLEQRLRMVHDRPEHTLPSGRELDKLARRLGYASGGSLERAYLVWTRAVRACYVTIIASDA